jgi:hypothetical protein
MIEILAEVESTLEVDWPYPGGVSPEAAAVEPAVIWLRIEQWVAWRWSPRQVAWTLKGPGCWSPRLAPFSLEQAERWDGTGWASTELDPAPIGYELGEGTFRVSGIAGDDADLPEEAIESYRRLAEYWASPRDHRPGSSSETINIGGDLSQTIDRPPGWLAKAMSNSGAADLLRRFRRA